MKSISLLNSAASIATLTVIVIAFIDTGTVVDCSHYSYRYRFAGSLGYVFYAPSILRRNAQSTDASQMAALGMLGTVSIVLLMATGGGFGGAGWVSEVGRHLLVFGMSAYCYEPCAERCAKGCR